MTPTMRFISLAVAMCCMSAISVSAAPAAPWQDILSLDCSGTLRFFPSHPLLRAGFNATVITKAATFVASTIATRAQCHCPSASAAQIGSSWTPDFGAVLAAIEAKADTSKTARQSCGIDWAVDQLGQYFQQFTLPSTCTSALYKSGTACRVALPVTGYGVTLQAAIQQCPGATAPSMPSVSISCSGNLCKDLLIPCALDSDCVSSTCTLIAPTTQAQIQTAISNALDSLGFMPKAEQNACAATTGKYSAANVGNKVFSALAAVLGNRALSAGTKTANPNIQQLGFCGVSQFMPVSLWSFLSDMPLINILPGFNDGGIVDEAINALLGLFPWTKDGTTYSQYCYRENNRDTRIGRVK